MKDEPRESVSGRNTASEKNIPKLKGSNKRKKVVVQNRHFHFSMFYSHIRYLSTEAREEDLTVHVFVPQVLGNTDEAGAGLRAVSHLQKLKTCVITGSH